MKGKVFIVFVLFYFSGLFAQITIYDEVGKNPDKNDLGGRAEAAQGITSDRLNYWFFSNQYHIYRYDENFSNVSTDYVGKLSEVNDAIGDASCGHLGSIHYFDGYIYAEVDDCTRSEPSPGFDFSDGTLDAFNIYFDDKYGVSGEVNIGMDDVVSSPWPAVYYKLNDVIVETCLLVDGFFCYTRPSFSVKFSAETLNAVGYKEFVTPDGLPIKSSGCAYNPVDGLFYNQCPANITLESGERSRNLNSICGFDFSENNYSEMLKSIVNLGEDHPRNISDDWWNQGGTFAENGVFLYVLDDASYQDECPYSGFHVYYPDYANVYEENGIKIYESQRFAMGNIQYNPDVGEWRREELEGLTVWRNSPLGGDIHIVKLLNKGGDDKIWLHHFESGDWDDDYYDDMIDNCPLHYNPRQTDFNNNLIGNACDGDIDGDGILNEDDNTPYYYDESNSRYLFCPDSDFDNVCDDDRRIPPSLVNELGWEKMIGADVFSTVDIAGGLFFAKEDDGIFSITDNCPDVKNFAVEASINDELISGGCSNGVNQDGSCTMETEGGAVRNFYTMKNGYYKNRGTGIFRDRVWRWQPDHDLDGIGDACDSAAISGDGYKTVSRLISLPTDFYDGNSSGDSVSGIHFAGIKYKNRFVNIHYKFEGKADGTDNSGDPDVSETDVSTMYCWVRDTDFDEFGKEGFCTRNDNGDFVLPSFPKFGYSHGSDPVPYNLDTGDPSWKEPVRESTEFGEKYAKVKWDWLENLGHQYPLLYKKYVTEVAELEAPEDFMKYTVSSGVKENYEYLEFSHLIPDDLNGYKVNPAFFYNKKIFARARRDAMNDMKGTFLSYYELGYEGVIPGRIYLDPYPRYPEFIDSCPECWHMPEGINGLINIWKYDYMEGVLSTTLKGLSPVGETGTYLSTPDGTIAAISKYEGALFISFNRSNLSDMTVAAVTTIPSDGIVPGKAAIAGGTLYFAGESTLYTVQRISDEFPEQTSEELPVADLVTVAQLPYPASEMRFFGIGNNLYGLHDDGRTMSMYVLNDNEFVEAADSGDYPTSRMQGAFRVINGELYLAGGGNSYGEDIERFSDVWKYNTETGWNLIADNLDMETLDLFMESDGENLYLFSRTYPDKEVETAVVNISEGTVEYEKTEVTGDALLSTPKEDICLNREGNSVFPGKLKYNQCSRFEEYQYKKYSFFDYKFSLSGKDRYLFSGGLSGIRTFKIKKNGKLKKTHFKTLGLINSIAIYGSTLFAAGGNRVHILKIGKNGKLKKTGSIKTDECWNIRVENGYLFTGEDGKVKIYDIRTNSTPRLIKKVSLSYNVKDLEVKGNSLFVYHEAGWWFWKKNEVQKIDITDVYNPVKLNKISFECTDVEFTKDRGTVYMGCKNGQKEIVEDGDSFSLKTVGGKKNYFRDSYFYNGVGYTVHSGSIYLSR